MLLVIVSMVECGGRSSCVMVGRGAEEDIIEAEMVAIVEPDLMVRGSSVVFVIGHLKWTGEEDE